MEWWIPTGIHLERGLDFKGPLDGRLVWDEEQGREEERKRGLGPNLLEEFLLLGDPQADDLPNRILLFAKSYGVLDLCRHKLPFTHTGGRASGMNPCRPVGIEPVRVWLSFAKRARAIFRGAASLHAGKRGEIEGWNFLLNQEQLKPLSKQGLRKGAPRRVMISDPRTMKLDDLQQVIGLSVSKWLRDGQVVPEVSWKAGEPTPRFQLWGQGLFAALGILLAIEVSRAQFLTFCFGCGDLFTPSRKPREGQNSWCDFCREDRRPEQWANWSYRQSLSRQGEETES